MHGKEVTEDITDASSAGDEELAIPVVYAVAEDEAAHISAAAAREAGIASIRDHCESHLALNPTSSYVTWIATLHPENAVVTIDQRFYTPDNPWLVVYSEVKEELLRRKNPTTTGENLAAPTAPTDVASSPSRSSTSQQGESSGDELSHSQESSTNTKTFQGSCLDSIIGSALVLSSIMATFMIELIAAVCYLHYWLFIKIPIVYTCGIAYLIARVFQLLDMILLLSGVTVVECIAVANYIIVTILSLSHSQGKVMHQSTRKLPHVTRWAFRQPFETWDPPRTNCFAKK